MVNCYPSGHSREEKSLLGMAKSYPSPPGLWAPFQPLPLSPWSALGSNPDWDRMRQGEPCQLTSAFFAACHQPSSEEHSPSNAPPLHPPPAALATSLALAQVPITFTKSCFLLASIICSSQWHQGFFFFNKNVSASGASLLKDPQPFPTAQRVKPKLLIGLWFVSHDMLSTYLSSLKFYNSTPKPNYTHAG